MRINEINELNEVSADRVSRQEVCVNVTRLISLISLISCFMIEFLMIEEIDSVEMWASKSLSLIWLPRCTVIDVEASWSDPCLQSLTAHPEHALAAPQEPNTNRLPEWFWRVNVLFGAWAHRAFQRAAALGAPVEESLKERYRIVLAYLDELDPSNGSRVIERSTAGPVSLPGREMIAALVNHARFGLCPKWDGWEALAAIDEQEEQQRNEERIRSRERRAADALKPLASARSRTASVAGMF